MNIEYLIQLLENKLNILNNARNQTFSIGDLEKIISIDAEILEVQNTLTQLNMLLEIKKAAAAANSTTAEVVASAVEAAQNPMQGPSASAIINGYDISAYATDALYEEKIQSFLRGMPSFGTAGDIDTYIQNVATGSPVTGEMVFTAAGQYSVDIPLMMAIMELDSRFGTAGIGVGTLNPGNIGNTGTSTRAYGSWQEGVVAVAEWLSRHRKIETIPATTPTTSEATTTPEEATTTQPTSSSLTD